MVQLNDGNSLPALGFGVFKIPAGETYAAVSTALETGYRLIDTAALYGNEAGVGRAVRESGLSRDEVFVTTKLANPDQGYRTTLEAFERSLTELGLDYADLYLIHWPCAARGLFVESYRAMLELRAAGRIRSVGVSNFLPSHLDTLIAETGDVPAVNQIELHPLLSQPVLREYGTAHGIHTQAWSPLRRGDVFDHPAVAAAAAETGRTPAQVVLRWHLQLGNLVIPKSVTPARIRENFGVFDFTLSDAAMSAISAANRDQRFGPDPAVWGNSD